MQLHPAAMGLTWTLHYTCHNIAMKSYLKWKVSIHCHSMSAERGHWRRELKPDLDVPPCRV